LSSIKGEFFVFYSGVISAYKVHVLEGCTPFRSLLNHFGLLQFCNVVLIRICSFVRAPGVEEGVPKWSEHSL
jgi:hypothetical protein